MASPLPHPDGAKTYWFDGLPDALPPVRTGQLADAWSAASAAAASGGRGPARTFQFRAPGGEAVRLSLTDRDARCWAASVEQQLGLSTKQGLSICLRLLALVELIARAPALHAGIAMPARGTAPPLALLRAAANAPLTAHATFDEREFLHALSTTRGAPVP